MATVDSLPFIDMTTLTQSELKTLSLFSSTAIDLTSHNHVPPTIDRTHFNESAGSRKQTFSRPTAASTHHHHHLRHRIAPSTATPSLPPHLDPDHIQNRTILGFLRQSLSQSPHFHDIQCLFASPEANRKRKRGRKPKVKSLEENLEMVNENGEVVDLIELAKLEDPYGEELRRRTVGLERSEENLLGFLRDLGGQWCSRRKKRKIVDAHLLGDALPLGWKLLLGLKRRDGRASVYCRRYISPGGHHFLTCKEVAEYLKSYFELHEGQQAMHHRGESMRQDSQKVSESGDDLSQSNQQEKQVMLLGIDNLAEVQIHDLFECHKCDMSFDEKDAYLQHLLSVHQRTTRKYRLGSSVGDGVIIKDGKFQCQFCHKEFDERRRYNGHVGIHVRNYVRGKEETPGKSSFQESANSPKRDECPARISRMDALIEIAQSSILETSSVGQDGKLNDPYSDKLQEASNSRMNSDHEMNSESSLGELELNDGMIEVNLEQKLDLEFDKDVFTGEKTMKIQDVGYHTDVRIDYEKSVTDIQVDDGTGDPSASASIAGDINKTVVEVEKSSESQLCMSSSNEKVDHHINSNTDMGCSTKSGNGDSNETDDNRMVKLEIGCGCGGGETESVDDKATDIAQRTLTENMVQYEVSESALLLQTEQSFPTCDATASNKVEDEFSRVEQRLESVTGFEELKLDEIEHLKFNFETGQESLTLQEVPLELANDAGIQGPYNSSVQFESGEVLFNMGHANRLTTVCVWCGVEFNHEGLNSEVQSDSVGYMCPSCKAKISGQLADLGSC